MTDLSLLEKLQIAHVTTGQKMFKEASDAIEAQGKRIEELEKEINCWHEAANWPEKSPSQLRSRIAELEAAMREIYEVYAGSEGFIPETCAEGYQQQLIKEMADIAARHMRKGKR